MTRAEVVDALTAERFAPRPSARPLDTDDVIAARVRDLRAATEDYITTELVVLPGGRHHRQVRRSA